MFNFILYVIVGFVVALVFRAVSADVQGMSFVVTSTIGIVAALLGGLMARLFFKPDQLSPIYPAGFRSAIVFSVMVLFLILYFRV